MQRTDESGEKGWRFSECSHSGESNSTLIPQVNSDRDSPDIALRGFVKWTL